MTISVEEKDLRRILREELDTQLDIKLEEKLDRILDKKLEEKLESKLDSKLDKRFLAFESRLDNKFELKFAEFFGQWKHYLDGRLSTMEDRMNVRFERIESSLYGLVVDRLDTDEIERAAMSLQLDRHGRWIKALAKKNNAKLSPT